MSNISYFYFMMSRAGLTFLLFLFIAVCGHSQNRRIDSLEQELKRIQLLAPSRANDSLLANLNYNLAGLLKARDPDRAIGYSLSAILKFKAIEKPRGIGNSIILLGTAHKNKADYPRALNFAKMALRIGSALQDTLMICNSYNNIGNTYMELSNYPEALRNHFLVMKIRELRRDSSNLDDTYNNIGSIYARQDDFKNASKFYQKSLQIRERIRDSLGIADLYSNLAYAEDAQNNYRQALEFHRKAIALYNRFNEPGGLINEYNNLGGHYFLQKKFDSTIRYQKMALTAFEEMNDPVGLAGAYNNLGSLSFELGNYKDAKNYALKAEEISKRTGYLEWLKASYDLLYQVSQKTGQYKEAYEYHVRYSSIKDSILNENNSREIGRLEARSDYEKKQAIADEKHRIELEKQKELAALEQKQKNQIMIFVLCGSGMLLIFLAILYKRYQQSQKQKAIIENQKKEVESQKFIIEEKQKEIIDSINYAERIQNAILVTEDQIRETLPESFLYYKPKDIVAGDFYFFEKTDGHLFYAAADCTCHGVPGALVSVVCSNALSRCVHEFKLTDAGLILDKARELVLETFKKSGRHVKDGMDISMLVKDLSRESYAWSGANNPLWYCQGGTIKEITADKQPIGYTEKPRPFKTHYLDLKKGDLVFLFTDGFADQFGGPKGKKFKYRQLQELLLKADQYGMSQMKERLETALTGWMGNLEQVDDICVIGFRV